ncbi:acetylglutamate kinase [Virgibacillus siamensis]|uniref:acetylglutamate kinase n=1 Tax=Virgibacillus siamensis TaxID=480071 RepID=UPI00158EBDF2|nr:acetylglutamate kinase [Virgibacillus siamensis]
MSYTIIKCGGSVLDQLPESFYENIVQMAQSYDINPIIVHGGGPHISDYLQRLNVDVEFVGGMRVTTEETLDITELVLSGLVNKKIVRNLNKAGGTAYGLSGVDGMLLEAEEMKPGQHLGYVGKIIAVNTDRLKAITAQQIIPVLSPLSADRYGQRWNINADLAAAAIAIRLDAPLYMVSNISGVMDSGKLVNQLDKGKAEEMVSDGSIFGGMIPKVQAAFDCVQQGVKKVVILNGLAKDSIPDVIAGKRVGTVIGENEMMEIQKGG